MHRNSIYISLIIIFSIVLMSNSFHRHVDLASMSKCPVCSGKYAIGSTHDWIKTPEIVQSVAIALPPPSCAYLLIINPVPRSLNDRAPPIFCV